METLYLQSDKKYTGIKLVNNVQRLRKWASCYRMSKEKPLRTSFCIQQNAMNRHWKNKNNLEHSSFRENHHTNIIWKIYLSQVVTLLSRGHTCTFSVCSRLMALEIRNYVFQTSLPGSCFAAHACSLLTHRLPMLRAPAASAVWTSSERSNIIFLKQSPLPVITSDTCLIISGLHFDHICT